MRLILILFFIAGCNWFQENQDSSRKSRLRPGVVESSEEDAVNFLEKQEKLLHERRKNQGQKMRSKPKAPSSICRRFPACMQYCLKNPQHEECMDLPGSDVVDLWDESIDEYDFDQVVMDLEWISTDRHAALFLYDTDHKQRVMYGLVSRLSQEKCPVAPGQSILYAEDSDRQVALFLAHPDGEEKGVKQITRFTDDIRLPIFVGLVKHCLNNKTASFLDMAIMNKNNRGFILGHDLLRRGCEDNVNCMKLAYCQLNLRPSWDYLEGVVITLQQEEPVVDNRCQFETFQVLPIMSEEYTLISDEQNEIIQSLDETDLETEQETSQETEQQTGQDVEQETSQQTSQGTESSTENKSPVEEDEPPAEEEGSSKPS